MRQAKHITPETKFCPSRPYLPFIYVRHWYIAKKAVIVSLALSALTLSVYGSTLIYGLSNTSTCQNSELFLSFRCTLIEG